MHNRRLPAEWEPQSGIMLVWPHAHGGWKPHLNDVEKTYTTIVSAICSHEIVVIVCFDETHRSHIKQLLSTEHNLQFVIAASDDSWVRDTGPLTVIESNNRQHSKKDKLCLLDFSFNGWGEKYPSALDNAITRHAKQAQLFGQHPLLEQTMVLEGGSIESDGRGTLLTTSSCFNNPSRNPNLSRTEIETTLQTQLGAERILWLNHGHLAGDDTDGHIDTLARFCSHETIAYTQCNDTSDIHYESLAAMAEELAAFKTTEGKSYRLLPLPIPAAIHNAQGERLPANYANFLITNENILVPTYNDPNDDVALQTLANCFPDRKIIGIDCRSLLQQFGSLHCATMQLPLGVLK